MKIAFIIPYHYNLYDRVQALKEQHSIQVISQERVRAIPSEIPHIILPGKHIPRGGICLSPKTLWDSLKKKPDIIIVKHIFSPTNLLVYCMAKAKKIPYIINVQKIRDDSPLTKLTLFIGTAIIGKKTRIIADTKEGYEKAKRYFKRVTYLPVCIDIARFKRKKYTRKKKCLKIICVAKYQRRKKQELLIDAVDMLGKKHRDISFEISFIGTNFSGNVSNSLKKERNVYSLLKEKVKKEKRKNIQLLKNVPNKSMPEEYGKHDLFVLPSINEELGFAVVEAMASGLPVLCSMDVGAKSYIKEGINGYIFEKNSAEAIAKAISEYIKKEINIKKLENMGKASRKIIEEEHSPKIYKKRFEEIINVH